MTYAQSVRILTVNSGSSSLKFALYLMDKQETLELTGSADGLGTDTASFRIEDDQGNALTEQSLHPSDHQAAVDLLLEWLNQNGKLSDLDVVGHRIVHGGREYVQPCLLTAEIMTELRQIIPLAPNHLPQELKIIEAIEERLPEMKHVVCFDTSFHRTMPELAQVYALPRFLQSEGVIRYGFHGLSYEYILNELEREAGPEVAHGRIIVAHLGSGASMAAIKNGKGIDTTMGFSPAGGLVMSTRCGDLDPGVILYLLMHKQLSPSDLGEMFNKEAGLLGVSGISADMKELLDNKNDPRAAEAVGVFCYQAKKLMAGLAAALGGLDMLVFTGGIGEHSPPIREDVCRDMEFLGIRLDLECNNRNAPVISDGNGPVSVRVMKTNEDLMIARHTRNCFEQIKEGIPGANERIRTAH